MVMNGLGSFCCLPHAKLVLLCKRRARADKASCNPALSSPNATLSALAGNEKAHRHRLRETARQRVGHDLDA